MMNVTVNVMNCQAHVMDAPDWYELELFRLLADDGLAALIKIRRNRGTLVVSAPHGGGDMAMHEAWTAILSNYVALAMGDEDYGWEE